MSDRLIKKRRPINLPVCLTLRLGEHQRNVLEELAAEKRITLGEAARELLNDGMRARGLV